MECAPERVQLVLIVLSCELLSAFAADHRGAGCRIEDYELSGVVHDDRFMCARRPVREIEPSVFHRAVRVHCVGSRIGHFE